MHSQVGFLGEVLVQQTVDIIVCTTLPRAARQLLLAAMRGGLWVTELNDYRLMPVVVQFLNVIQDTEVLHRR